MVKFISQIIGAQVLLFQERAFVGEVADVLIDPKDGSFAGIELIAPKLKQPLYVPASEIKGFGQKFVLIKGENSLSGKDEVVRIKKILEDRPQILKSKVYQESGGYIGRVEDATLDFKLLSLERLYVNPKISTKFLAESLIIPAKTIIKIEPRKIIIQDGEIKQKEARYATRPTPALD